MIPEFGQFALVLALCLAIALTVLPSIGVFTHNTVLMRSSRSLATGMWVMTAIAFAVLVYVFVHDDFSVQIVALQSNTKLPDAYKVTATWGGHEGSLLLWVLILATWTLAVAAFSRQLPLDMVARVLAVMGGVAVGFLLFMLLTSNPFARNLPNAPTEGADLNPLLQDPGMVIHPPMLYMGYVGFSVAFAFAIAALWSGRLDVTWARWSRPWTVVAWMFLTVGIALGSWWAYYELGWGGWWFWDPVENASFMPWLVGTALIHSLAVTDKRGLFKSWTVLLAIFAFSLSLLGTFLVRSGVLTSVHSFAADPERGLFILAFLGIVIGASLTLYALRAPNVSSRADYAGFSREVFLLINNVLMLIAAVTVLAGTLFPLIADALGLGKYSVGPPYFNAVFVPLMALVIAFMGVGPSVSWKNTRANEVVRRVLPALIASVVIGLIFPFVYGGEFHIGVVATAILSGWLVLATLRDLQYRLRLATPWWSGLRRLPLAYYAMVVAHFGFAVTAAGVGLTTVYSIEHDVRMEVGQRETLAGYDFVFNGTQPIQGPNYVAQRGSITVLRNERVIAELHPEKRRYLARSDQMMTEAAIDAGLMRDVYVAMGESLGTSSNGSAAWAIRLHYKPFVRWIWLGAILMGIGGGLAASDKRYRVAQSKKIEVTGGAIA
jgi:cytochrome c-type biogenesis protein CcmF